MQPVFSVIAQEARDDQEEEFVKILEENLAKIAEEGIPRRNLLAAFNYYEFKYREANFGRFPKGLMYGLQMFDSWLYDDEKPFIHIKTNETFKQLRDEIENGYFENLIKEYLINNKHKSIVIMKPKKGLQKVKDQEEANKLKAYKDSLSEDEVKKLVEETKQLKASQEEASTKEELEKIPVIDIEDIRKDVKPLSNVESELGGVKVLWHQYFTNKIAYVKLAFDMSHIPMNLVPYASFLAEILTIVDTTNYSYQELGNEISIETGGIGATMDVMPTDVHEFLPMFILKTKCFYSNITKAFELLKEVAFESKLDDKKRLKEIIGQIYTNLKITLTETGHKSAANRAMSYFSEYAAYREAIQGITMFDTVKKWYENFEEEYDNIVNGLKKAAKAIFEKQNMTISYTGKEEAPEFMKAEVESFIEGLYEDQKQDEKVKVICTKNNEGFATAGGVQYVACAGNFKDAGLEYTGALKVLQMIFSYEYLWIQLRVKGGAYGCMCSFSDQGDSMFVTYRDPNLAESYKVYDEAADYVANFDADDRDMKKYIIGTIGNMDIPMEAVDMGARSFHAYFLGKTEADLQKDRDQVLSCTQADIRALAPIVKAVVESGNRCCIGNEEKIDQNKEYFDEVKHVL